MKQWLSTLTQLKQLPLWLLLAFAIGLLYLGVSHFGYGYTGFPLDDGWIHQTYARNLGWRGQFSFTPGVPSTGSTAPLWTILLSVGYALHLPFKWWTYGLGMVCLGLSGFYLARIGQRLFPDKLWLGPLIGLTLLLEWHLGWAAVSGMETLFFIACSICLVERFVALMEPDLAAANGSRRQRLSHLRLFGLGFIGGCLTLIRPEGLGLAGLVGLGLTVAIISRKTSPKQLLGIWVSYGFGLILPLIPYLIFNVVVSGSMFPNTLYAKQQEYGLWIQEQFSDREAFWFRLQVFSAPFIGLQILLIPGIVKAMSLMRNKQTIYLLIPLLWWVSHATLFFLRLPVTYQHARYQMPVIPWILLLGLGGTTYLLKPRHRHLWPRVLSRAAMPTMGLVTVIFVGLGVQSYGRDVRIIETEMVDVALWLHENTEPETIIAAHDIGAIGYFSERPIVDLAGLITPDVIPFIRDEAALLEFSLANQAEYLVTFPSWYPEMTADLTPIYSTQSPWAIAAGNDNMAVFILPPP